MVKLGQARTGEVCMHITMINDMSMERWVEKWTKKDLAFYEQQGADVRRCMNMVAVHGVRLREGIENVRSKFNGGSQSSQQVSSTTTAPLAQAAVVAPVQQVTAPVVRPDKIKTDMGDFVSVHQLERQLPSLVPVLDEETAKELVAKHVGGDFDYLSQAQFDVVAKQCVEGVMAFMMEKLGASTAPAVQAVAEVGEVFGKLAEVAEDMYPEGAKLLGEQEELNLPDQGEVTECRWLVAFRPQKSKQYQWTRFCESNYHSFKEAQDFARELTDDQVLGGKDKGSLYTAMTRKRAYDLGVIDTI